MNVNEALKEHMMYIRVTKSKGTLEYYEFYHKKISDHFGNLDVDSIANLNILEFIDKEHKNNPNITNATLNKAIQTLKTAVKYSAKVNIEFPKLKERKKLIEIIPETTIKKLFNYYESSVLKTDLRNHLYLRLLYDTGLRLNEMNNLKLSNIDIDSQVIHVSVTKTDLDRFVIFTKKTKYVLLQYLLKFKPDEYLFYSSGLPDTKLSTTSVQTFISRIKKKLSITDNITPHKWRHTFATRFLRNGGDLETLRLILGHTKLTTTQKYLHMNKKDLIENYKRVIE